MSTISDSIIKYLDRHPKSDTDQLLATLDTSPSTLRRHLHGLVEEGRVVKSGHPPGEVYYSLPGNTLSSPKNIQNYQPGLSPPQPIKRSDASKDPTLVHLEVTNPITYLKLWWKKIMGKEGINIRFNFRIRPLTAIALATIFLSFGIGIGRLSFLQHTPVAKYLPTPTPTPSPVRTVTIQPSKTINLTPYLNQTILIIGTYHPTKKTLTPTHAQAINPTTTPTPTPNQN